LFWSGAAGIVCWLVPSAILRSIDAWTVVATPALIGLCFGAMVLAVVSGSGSYSLIIGRPAWKPLATGSYALYLTHMMVLPVAAAVAPRVVQLGPEASLAARWTAFVPWYLALTVSSAYVLHRYIERPALAWRERRLRAAAPTSVDAPVPHAA
jgi:peptidoglycan/LPS O-acetylase OafA/YrhL